jgi:hypothetical protein
MTARRAAPLAVFFLLLAVSACGGDSPASGTATASLTEATATTGSNSTAETISDDLDATALAIAAALDAPHELVESADGAAELVVPDSSLPEGLAAADLKITSVPPAESGVTIDGQPPALVYSLEPDGTAFSSPVVVRLTIPLDPEDGIPELLLLSDGRLSPLTATAEVDSAAGEVVFSAPISHFSSVVGTDNSVSYFGGEWVDPTFYSVGAPFTLGFRMWPLTGRQEYQLNGESFDVILDEWSIKGAWEVEFGPVEPRFVTQSPPLTRVGGPDYTARQKFNCVDAGYAAVVFRGTIAVIERVPIYKYTPFFRTDTLRYLNVYNRITFECLGEDVIPTPPVREPTPTPTAQPTATPIPMASIRTTFDDGLEGWAPPPPIGSCNGAEHQSGGGNPGGFLFVDNDERLACRLLAPEKFRGAQDLRGFYGGTISFDGKIFEALDETWDGSGGHGGPEGANYGTVTISGWSGVIKIDLAKVPPKPKPQEPPWNGWLRHVVSIVPGPQPLPEGGTAQWTDNGGKPVGERTIKAVLEHVTSVDLNVEAVFGEEKQGIDNFAITAASWNPTALSDIPPAVQWLGANYEEYRHTTFYEIRVFDDDWRGLRFDWKLSSLCGEFTWEPTPRAPDQLTDSDGNAIIDLDAYDTLTGVGINVATWTHTPCPDEPDHPGTITVEVTDSDGNYVICRYTGGSKSASQPIEPWKKYPDGFECT